MITWKLWASVPTVALWEAVALVLEIEPTNLLRMAMAGPGRGPFFERRSFPSQAKRADFDKALSWAERAASLAGPICLRTGLHEGMNKRTAQVTLAEVVAFFVSCEWPNIPAPLLALVSAAASKPADDAAEPVEALRAFVADRGVTVVIDEPDAAGTPTTVASGVKLDDPARLRIQAQAAEEWIRWLANNGNPTVHAICGVVAKWCRDHGVKTRGGVHPSAGTLRNAILGARHWTPPNMQREKAREHVARLAQA